MKKFKYLPGILMLVLCLTVLAVRIYAAQPSQNTIQGNIVIGASKPGVNLTVYYVPDGVTAENAVLNDDNKIGKTKTARYGVELDLTDDRLTFNLEHANRPSDVKAQTIAIKIENKSNNQLGAYFTNLSQSQEVKTEMPLSTYTSNTFEANTLVEGYAKANFSQYTTVPAKQGETFGEAIVTMSISIVNLPSQDLYIQIDSFLILEEYNESKDPASLINLPHLAINVKEEDYLYSPTQLSTETTSIDAEVVNADEGIYVGLVNLQYTDVAATALTSNGLQPSAKPLSATALNASKATFSFNYSATVGETTISAEDLLTDEKMQQGLAGIGVGTYSGIVSFMPDFISGNVVQLSKGTDADFTVSGNTITITYTITDSLSFFIVHETSEGMKINLSVPSNSTNLSLINVIDNTLTSYTPLTSAQTSISTASNVEIADGAEAGVIPMRAFKTTLEKPSFNFQEVYNNGEPIGAEALYNYRLIILIKGTYLSVVELMAQETNVEPLTYGEDADYYISGTEIIFNNELLSESDFDFTIYCLYDSRLIESGIAVYASGGNGTNAFAVMQKTARQVYDDYVEMGNEGSFTFTFVEEPTEIPKGDALSDYYVSISKIALKNIPDADSLTAAKISTNADYGSIYIMEQAVIDWALSIDGITLSDSLAPEIDTVQTQMGMYASAGTQTDTGTDFEILETFLPDGEKTFVLIMIADASQLSENLTKTVNFKLTLSTNIDPLIYTLSDDGTYYSISGLKADVESIKIPKNYQGLPIKLISSNAFEGSSLSSVDLSEATSLMAIETSAFSGCKTLSGISIPDSVTSIGTSAFYGCTGLTSITIPEDVINIGDNAFHGCTGLTEINYNAGTLETMPTNSSNIFNSAGTAGTGITVNIAENVEVIPDYLFYVRQTNFLPKITAVNFLGESKCISIGTYAFANCRSLTSITIPEGVTSIGTYAFSGCTGLTSITIPEGVTSIGDFAFSGCTGLTEINYNATMLETMLTNSSNIFNSAGTASTGTTLNIAENVEVIPDYLFSVRQTAFSPKITTVNFLGESKCISIGDSAFSGCTGLTSITIPEGVTSIGDSAFYYCESLTSITIPSLVTSIGDSAFSGCTDLIEINYNAIALDTVPTDESNIFWEAGTAGTGITVNIAENVEVIPDYLFYVRQINFLPKITAVNFLGASKCISIGTYAFSNCRSLTSITIPVSVTSIGYSAFYGCTNLKTIVVEAHEDAAATPYNAMLPTIEECTWYVYEGDSETGTVVTTNYIQYSNVKYTYKAIANP